MLLSDTHLGITDYRHLQKLFAKAAKTEPSIIVHAGDYSGGRDGPHAVESTCKLMREIFPHIPILSVCGNHDYWSRNRNERELELTFGRLAESFDSNDITWLDSGEHYLEDGLLIAGHTGWYGCPHLTWGATNDKNFLPGVIGEVAIHEALLEMSTDETSDILQNISSLEAKAKVWVSHFGIGSSAHLVYGGDRNLQAKLLGRGFEYFLEGHSHKALEGPHEFNSGSDYQKPIVQTIVWDGKELKHESFIRLGF